MATVTWMHDPIPTPPATFTLTLDQDEALVLKRYLSICDGADRFRLKNRSIYGLEHALKKALKEAEAA